jgi:hypothetical protein
MATDETRKFYHTHDPEQVRLQRLYWAKIDAVEERAQKVEAAYGQRIADDIRNNLEFGSNGRYSAETARRISEIAMPNASRLMADKNEYNPSLMDPRDYQGMLQEAAAEAEITLNERDEARNQLLDSFHSAADEVTKPSLPLTPRADIDDDPPDQGGPLPGDDPPPSGAAGAIATDASREGRPQPQSHASQQEGPPPELDPEIAVDEIEAQPPVDQAGSTNIEEGLLPDTQNAATQELTESNAPVTASDLEPGQITPADSEPLEVASKPAEPMSPIQEIEAIGLSETEDDLAQEVVEGAMPEQGPEPEVVEDVASQADRAFATSEADFDIIAELDRLLGKTNDHVSQAEAMPEREPTPEEAMLFEKLEEGLNANAQEREQAFTQSLEDTGEGHFTFNDLKVEQARAVGNRTEAGASKAAESQEQGSGLSFYSDLHPGNGQGMEH